jgi:hypothetical protein
VLHAQTIVHDGVLNAGTHLISRPYMIEDLAAKVRAILDGCCIADRGRRRWAAVNLCWVAIANSVSVRRTKRRRKRHSSTGATKEGMEAASHCRVSYS